MRWRCWRSASSRCWRSTSRCASQAWLPLNPQGLANLPPDLAFNTAASFTTNTNWQSYVGETTMSYLTQMAGLAYHNFVSAAVGIALAIALIRGVAGRPSRDPRQLLGRHDPCGPLGAAAVLCRRRAASRVARRRAELPPVRPGGTGRSAGRRDAPGDRAGAGRLAGSDQGVGDQRRRLLQRQQRPPVREPDAAHQLPPAVRHLRDLGGPHLPRSAG